jgi:hypothetical protein
MAISQHRVRLSTSSLSIRQDCSIYSIQSIFCTFEGYTLKYILLTYPISKYPIENELVLIDCYDSMILYSIFVLTLQFIWIQRTETNVYSNSLINTPHSFNRFFSVIIDGYRT